MKLQHCMPGIIIGASLIAAIGYTVHGDWRRAIYWLAAAILNLMVTLQ